MNKLFYIVCCWFSLTLVYGQNLAKVDSLKNIIKGFDNDTIIAKAYEQLTISFYPNNFDSVLFYGNKTLSYIQSLEPSDTSSKKVILKCQAKILNVKGNVFYMSGDVLKALTSYHKGIDVNKELKDLQAQASLMSNLAALYNSLGDIERSLEYNHKSLQMRESLNLSHDIAISLNNLGAIYTSQKEYESAHEFYSRSLKIRDSLGDKKGVSSVYNNLGILKKEEGKNQEALSYYFKGLAIDREIDNKDGIVISLINIGNYFKEKEDLDSAQKYYKKGLEISREINFLEDEIHCLNSISSIYLERDNIEQAKFYANLCFEKANEIGYPILIEGASQLLFEIYEEEGDVENALPMLKLAIQMKDSVFSEETQYSTIKNQTKYEYEKKKEIDEAIFEKQLALEKEEKAKQLILIIAIVIVLVLFSIFSFYVYRRLQITKKQNKLIEEQRLAVEEQKKEITHTHEKLAETTKELHDSIAYAELIQQAVLPTLKIEDLTKESFIYFNPKEKVSGDFYWIEQKDEYHGYAVADCTGHGIPGAFISMVGTILLNEIYNSKQIYVPNEILDELSRLVRLTLTNKDGHTMKDGMDISFAVLDNNTKMLYFSGANNPVWIVSRDSQKRINKETATPLLNENGLYLYEIKGDRQPVGDYGDCSHPFTLNSAHLEEGDAFYLFSDGFVDQFGGERGKKFKAKPFRSLLLSIYHQSMKEQEESLSARFESWRGDLEQIDDVTIMGVRV